VDLNGDDQDLEDLRQIVEGVHLELMAHVDGHGAHQVAGMLAHCRSPTTRYSGVCVPMDKIRFAHFDLGEKKSRTCRPPTREQPCMESR